MGVWLWRGYVVSKFTLTRFYTLHFLLPLAMAVLLLRHLHLLHGTRGSSLSYAPVKLSFFPFFAVKDAMMWLFYLTVFLLFVCLYSNLLGDAENYIPANPLVTPTHIKPEWYFLFAYAILRCIPSKRIRVLILVLSITYFYILSFTSINNFNFGFKLNFIKFSFILWCFNFILLTYLGGIHVIPYYVIYAQYFSILYFTYLILLT